LITKSGNVSAQYQVQHQVSFNVSVATSNGATVDLEISGNVTSSEVANVTIATNQSATSTTVSFTETGESGTTGFGNVTIPKNAVPYGITPTIYIDNQITPDQGYSQDANNYYVWYTTHFSTHKISIVFTATAATPEFSSWVILALMLIATMGTVAFALRKGTKSNS
jgi:hypothetical protein